MGAFIRNCWYVIAWDHEIADGALFARTVLNEPILVYRLADVQAFEELQLNFRSVEQAR